MMIVKKITIHCSYK